MPEQRLYFGQYDLADAFYQFGIPQEWSPLFGLPPLDVSSWPQLRGAAVGKLLYPQLCVLPMGWTHALYWRERIHCEILPRHIPRGSFLSDLRPATPLQNSSVSVYVDNVGVYADSEEVCRDVTQKALAAVREAGLIAHEVDMCGKGGELLGFEARHGGLLVPKARRRWQLWYAWEHLLGRRRCSGRRLMKVLGHFAHQGLPRSASLSAMRAIYVFCEKYEYEHRRLWLRRARASVDARALAVTGVRLGSSLELHGLRERRVASGGRGVCCPRCSKRPAMARRLALSRASPRRSARSGRRWKRHRARRHRRARVRGRPVGGRGQRGDGCARSHRRVG